MHCPFCHSAETKVIDSRLADDGSQVRRRRECLNCHDRFTTYETVDLNFPRVSKRDGVRTEFCVDKLRMGILRALEKRPVSMADVDRAMNRILHQVRAAGEREISTKFIGECVMTELRQLDQVAYVRFASVYRSFQDVSAFQEEISRLLKILKRNTMAKFSKSQARHAARRCAVQVLYQWQFNPQPPQVLADFLALEFDLSSVDMGYFFQLVNNSVSSVDELDAQLSASLDRPLKSLHVVELSILRLAVYELCHSLEVPYRVVINEAIELAKEFGATEGHKYVNGVLHAIARQVRVSEV